MAVSESAGVQRTPGREVPAVWGNVPRRNKNFTGREDLLRDLWHRITDESITAVLPHALHGMGGVGKTQLAIEYCYLHEADYDVVWWISADQDIIARGDLAALAPRLGLTAGGIDDAVANVLDALRRGEPYSRWLLVFDNADQPAAVLHLMPQGPGHVLVTSRNHGWESVADTVEVDVFERSESLQFLSRRVPQITDEDGRQLAEELGDLPLALEQAGALLNETTMPVGTYLELFRQQAGILNEGSPSDYPVPVAAAWSVSEARVLAETPHAIDLLRRCAFFGPEPIPLALFDDVSRDFSPPLQDILSDPLVKARAIGALRRYGLARIDNRENTLQVHRILQRLIRDGIDPEQWELMRRDVHLLLAAYDPGRPDDAREWPRYAGLLAHAEPSLAVESSQPPVRRLVRNLVRYLYAAGDYPSARSYAEATLQRWDPDSGEGDRDVLMMKRHLGNVLWVLTNYQAAYDLNRRTLERMREVLGEDHEETLSLTNSHAADLRVRGDFADARALDEESVRRHRRALGDDHPRTFMAVSNLALDYWIAGDYRTALKLLEQNYQDRLDFYGREDDPQVLRALDNLARAQRQLGHHATALKTAERCYRLYQEIVQQGLLPKNHPSVLRQARDLSIILRRVGRFAEAHTLASEVYERLQRVVGPDHPRTLNAAIGLSNCRRVIDDLSGAAAGIEDAVQRYRKVIGPDHAYTQGAVVNLAIVRRRLGDAAGARILLQEALIGLEHSMGRNHDLTLRCAVNLASALADLGETEAARQLGEDTLQRLRSALGEDHPYTLACAANLALDLRALGREQDAAELMTDTLTRYRTTLGEDHPYVRAATDGHRFNPDFEPPPL